MGQDFFLGDQMQDRHIEAALGGNCEASAALSVTVGAVPWPWEGPAPEPALASKSFCRSYILIVNLLLSEMSSFSDCSLSAEGHFRYFVGSDSDWPSVCDFNVLDWNLPIISEMLLVTEEKSEKLTLEERPSFCRGKIVLYLLFQKFTKFFSAVSSELQIRDLKSVKEKVQCCNSGEIQVTGGVLSKYNLGNNAW